MCKLAPSEPIRSFDIDLVSYLLVSVPSLIWKVELDLLSFFAKDNGSITISGLSIQKRYL